jgi:hypothetical protein
VLVIVATTVLHAGFRSAEIRKSQGGYYVVLSSEMVVKGIVASLNSVNVVTE